MKSDLAGVARITPSVAFLLGAAVGTLCALFLASPASAPGGRHRPLQVASWINVSALASAAAHSNSTTAAPPSSNTEDPTPYKALEEALRNASTADGTVIVTQVTEAWTSSGSLLDLFMESFHAGEGTQRLLDHLLIICMDRAAHVRCLVLHRHCYLIEPDDGGNVSRVDYRSEKVFMSKDYLNMMWGRNALQLTILELGFNFLFTDLDVLWFRDPFRHIAVAADISISSDVYLGLPYDLGNFPNGGFLYVRASTRTVEFYREWQRGRVTYLGKNEQDVFNKMKREVTARLGVTVQFLDTQFVSGFCQLGKDLNKVCTVHANCCVGLGSKLHDLRSILDDWRNYTAMPPAAQRWGNFQWRLPGICMH